MSLFQRLFAGVSVTVDGYMGSVNPVGGFQQLDVAVCTIEKANGLVNRLVRDDNISQLGTAVCPSLKPRYTLTEPGLVCTVLTYLCLFAHWEHRSSTKECHCFLSVAIPSISLLV